MNRLVKRFISQSFLALDSKRLVDVKFNSQSDSVVKVRFDDGNESSFHGIWLRDHCKCIHCHHAVTKQRLLDTSSISVDIKPMSAKIHDNTLKLRWSDGHESIFDSLWLHRNSYYPRIYNEEKRLLKFWGRDLVLPIVSYSDVMNENDIGLAKWLNNIDTVGIGAVDGVPHNPTETERLARRIAFIKETHYGGFYDFTSNLEHGDTAYTNLSLSAHTDTTYYTEPMGLQGFHLLHHHGEGGESLFVDGFNAAKRLLDEYPWAYQILSTQRISAHSIGDSKVYMKHTPSSGFPILNLDPLSKELYQIRFNNNDRSPLLPQSPKSVQTFYKALGEWIKILKSPEFELQTKLFPGRFVMFNNWRVLHGRSAFTGSRRLIGCYIGMDDFKSRLRILNNTSKSNI